MRAIGIAIAVFLAVLVTGVGYLWAFNPPTQAPPGGSGAIAVDGANRVGIGTNGPGGILEVYAPTDSPWPLTLRNGAAANFWSIYPRTGGGLDFYERYNAGGYDFRMTIKNGGNVGIGTTSPDHKLEVEHTADLSMNIKTTGVDKSAIISMQNDARRWGFSVVGDDGDKLIIRDYTTPATRFVIDVNGYVGIGTTAPLATAHIRKQNNNLLSSAISSSDPFVFEADDATLEVVSNSGGTWGSALTLVDVTGATGALNNKWGIIRKTSGLDNSLHFTYGTNARPDSNSSFITFNSSGNVGIGTTSPSKKLDVYGGAYAANNEHIRTSVTYNSVNRSAGIGVAGGGSNWGVNLFADGNKVFTADTNGGVMIGGSYVDSSAPANGAIIQGNVGIGTAGPLQMLHISGAAPTIQLTDTDTGADTRLQANTATGGFEIQVDANNEVASSYFALYIDNEHKLRVDSAGNVGIGTATPGAKLDVNGRILGSGNNGSELYSLALRRSGAAGSLTAPDIYGNLADGTLSLAGDSAGGGNVTIAGNVGIGTASPGRLLDVNGYSRFRNTAFFGTNDDVGLISWGTMGGGNGFGLRAEVGRALSFGTNGTWDSVVISQGGNVGIGTTAPNSSPPNEVTVGNLDANDIYLRSGGVWTSQLVRQSLSVTTYVANRGTTNLGTHGLCAMTGFSIYERGLDTVNGGCDAQPDANNVWTVSIASNSDVAWCRFVCLDW